MKIYKYKDIEYKTESQLRKAIWYKERKALPKLISAEDWAKYDVEVKEIELVVTDKERSDPTDDELAKEIRSKRNALLAASDFFVMPDYPAPTLDLEAVVAYRQELRDITAQAGYPKNVTFPTMPRALRGK